MSLKRICEAGSETWQLNTATTRSQSGSLRVRERGSGWLDGFVSGTLAVQTCPLKPAAYVRRCGVRFEVVRGGTKRELRAFADDRSALACVARWAEYRASLSVDLLKADWNWNESGKFDFRDFGRFPRSSEWCGDLNYSATNESYFPGVTILRGFEQFRTYSW